jgi:hypothetical protein
MDISNYVVDVMNDVILKIELPKLTLSNFYMNAFGIIFHSTNYDDKLYVNLLKTLVIFKNDI